jgi:cytochrome P450
MMEATLTIISRTMFSSDSDRMVAIMERSAGLIRRRCARTCWIFSVCPRGSPGLGRIRVAARTLGEFDAEIDRLIKLRSSDPGSGPKDLLARLIAARDEQTGGGMTAQEVRDHVITIFMAGHETTAMAMTWTLVSIVATCRRRGEAARRTRRRARRPRAPTRGPGDGLSYTRMVIEESMRLYPPVHTIAREALADDTLAGLRVPKGSAVLISPWVLHRHRRLWRDPGRFDPERFSPEQAAAHARFSYLPFGGGRRICIGAAFAMAEATLLLATIAQRFRLRLLSGHPVEPQGLITLRPRHGMKMLLDRACGYAAVSEFPAP